MLSPQTQSIVDNQGFRSSDGTTVVGRIGIATRFVAALPLDGKPPRPLTTPVEFRDVEGFRVIDPTDGSVPGEPALVVHRLLNATVTRSTRGL